MLAYEGTAYHGWQVQPGAQTVQGVLLEALRPLAGAGVRVVGASRTDAGVHALGQVASIPDPPALAPHTVQAALNARLPPDIRVLDVRRAPGGFDARRSARLKRYGYLIATDPVPSPFLRPFAWSVGRPLDAGAMASAIARLRGSHDFSAFCAAPGRDRDPVCTVRAARVLARRGRIGILVSGDAFLHHMVRNVVGTLVEVGLGRRPPEWVGQVLDGRDRGLAGATAPAHGLYLLRVRYPVRLFRAGRQPVGGPHARVPGS